MTIRNAFVSDAAFTVDDHGYAAVVTADYTDKATGKFEIVCDILGYCEAVSISLNNGDILAMRELLGIGSEVERPFTYNELLTPKGRNDLDVALKALEAITALEASTFIESWQDIARQCIEIATTALAKINGEASNGTPNDS